ncbi:hypothetical protein F4677DRAFT_451161 [Hypoxylon crocopeplum]|nr:hypothetical protein F4677DRAFT_451161 [Hypoxylon crocopeplum]
MGFNKKRLYLALYPSRNPSKREELKYHLALIIGPKVEDRNAVPGMRYHAKNDLKGRWYYAEDRLPDVQSSVRLLARILIAKVINEKRLVEILRSVSIVQDEPDYNCREWIMEAVSRIAGDGQAVGTAQLEWAKIEERARGYVASKTAVGRYEVGHDMTESKPVWDMLQEKEIVP